MKSRAYPKLLLSISRMGLLIFAQCALAVLAFGQAEGGPSFADVPEDVSVRFVFKNSGNMNMVGAPDIPVIVSVVLTNKSEEERTVFVARFVNAEDSKPKEFPLGLAIRITDAKGTALLQNKDLPSGYFTSLLPGGIEEVALKKDGRNRFTIPPKERRGFNIPVAAVLVGGGTDATWPVVDGKFLPGAYRFKVKWAGKESGEFSLTVTSQ